MLPVLPMHGFESRKPGSVGEPLSISSPSYARGWERLCPAPHMSCAFNDVYLPVEFSYAGLELIESLDGLDQYSKILRTRALKKSLGKGLCGGHRQFADTSERQDDARRALEKGPRLRNLGADRCDHSCVLVVLTCLAKDPADDGNERQLQETTRADL